MIDEVTMLPIDRIAPTRRPHARPAGFQQWRDLLFLHWEVDADRLQAMIPLGLSVDCYDGKAYVGVVPFAMCEVRPWRWVPRWAAFRFLECNVRTYVHCQGRPGVYFFSLDAASRLAVWAARTFWSLPYFHANMRMNRQDKEIEYRTVRSKTNGAHHARYRIGAELGASQPGTIEHFLLERYLLFVSRDDRIQVGQVHHTPYPVFQVDLLNCEDRLMTAAGFGEPQGPPTLQHYSPGVDVEIFALRSL
jgi:uncharacterized protein YqjF (DUF2071 family)